MLAKLFSWMRAFLAPVILALLFNACAGALDTQTRSFIENRCLECHDAETKKGSFNIESLIDKYDTGADVAKWEKIDLAIAKGEMPPEKKGALPEGERALFAKWFEGEFVFAGGVQKAGFTAPRRLTREELQNTLEDLLGIPIRVTVTNSRLHVIPETVVEKFFPAGVYGESGFSNDAVALGKGKVDIQTMARCFSMILADVDPGEVEPEAWILDFAAKAFRRPLADREGEGFVKVYRDLSVSQTGLEALRSAMLAVLLSPEFWMRFEDSGNNGKLSNRDLAVRLAYFLWSAPPDGELLAANLEDEAVFRAQVRRMLADPKRVALAENLGGEWFDYKKLRQQSAVDRRNDTMAGFYRSQFEEALLFFDSLVRFDQSIFKIVDADWAYTNGHQTKLYKLQRGKPREIPGKALPPINLHYRDGTRQVETGGYEYKHNPMEIVFLDDPYRGGFITMGPTLSATSTQNRTSPIRRGVWVMERILGRHFVVPENVPDLEESQKKAKAEKLSQDPLEILKLHSSQPGCASCHKFIDPIGFGLEIYDQTGFVRPNQAVDPEGEKLHWTPDTTPRSYEDRSWEIKGAIEPGKPLNLHYQWNKGGARLDVKNVRLTAGEIKLADDHFGYSGVRNQKNIWQFQIPQDAPATGWTITATVKGDGSNDSHGTITVYSALKGPSYQLPNGNNFGTPAELKQRLLTDYKEDIIDNAIRRVLAYALGRKLLPIDRPAIAKVRSEIEQQEYRLPALLESVALSYPFRNKD